jgi:hypothetical protein
MAVVPTIESGDVFLDQITKEDVREYFLKIDCSLCVLGSQFGLEPSKLSDLEHKKFINLSTDCLPELLVGD